MIFFDKNISCQCNIWCLNGLAYDQETIKGLVPFNISDTLSFITVMEGGKYIFGS